MTNEIEIFYDKEFKNKSGGEIEFPPIIAGKETKKELYIKNNLDYKVNLEIEILGENVSIDTPKISIEPKAYKTITLSFNPKITLMKPIKANIKIKINYIII